MRLLCSKINPRTCAADLVRTTAACEQARLAQLQIVIKNKITFGVASEPSSSNSSASLSLNET
jgi:hypothetical protein